MPISVFDLFTVGIGPSSSHTVGPMRAARLFVRGLESGSKLAQVDSITVELYGSLALTGKAHGSDMAVLLGLEGATPEAIEPGEIDDRLSTIRSQGQVVLLGKHAVVFDEEQHLVFHRRETLPFHSNGMRFTARDAERHTLVQKVYYSVGGGFVVDEHSAAGDQLTPDGAQLPYPFKTGDEMLLMARKGGLSLSDMTLANETAWRSEAKVRSRLLDLWQTMQACVERGCQTRGVLPGKLKVARRAPKLLAELDKLDGNASDPLTTLDWVNVFAIAVNEENAAGGRVVTAPTNGAAGVIPAVLHYYHRFVAGADDDGIVRFLLAAGAIGILYKENASISGADVGCQGEVGVACSMAAAGLAEALGGTIEQVEEAAEIGMEHNLGLTCDPVGGLVQIPCIERNAMGAVKAINAARLALRGTGEHRVSLDKVIKTMRETGADMKTKYKESARGGLAVNVIEC